MAQTVSGPSPASLARQDLTVRGVVVMVAAATAVVVGLDLLDGRLGALFSVGFVLVVVTAPMAVDLRMLFPTGVLPPVLLVVALAVVAVVHPEAIVVDGLPADVSRAGRVLAGVVDHGVTLLVGHALAIGVIVLRILAVRERA
ncbi:MAG: hypothetical protein PGN07_05485 [Aeromicrobium erythreum]